MKVCSRCERSLPLTEFHMKGGGYRRPECKECFKSARPRHARSASHGIKARDKAAYQRYYKYGLTEDRYREMVSRQGGACAICNATDPGASDWQVDHDHQSGEIRGLLCKPCNIALGLLKDDVPRIMRAVEYLTGERVSG